MVLHKFTIIAGSNKCGTTSLFHYLSDHPQICPSRRKELLFFADNPSGPRAEVVTRYLREFTGGKPEASVALEASPQYLHAGSRRAENIHAILPDAKLLFIFRDPAARLVSYYRTDFGQVARNSYGLTFKEVVEQGLADIEGRGRTDRSEAFAQEIRMAYYGEYLAQYVRVWPRDRLKVLFFEQLVADARGTLGGISAYLGIDPAFYDSYRFEVENRTRGHRSRGLQRFGLAVNRVAEPVLIRFHGLKRGLRRMYNKLNETELQVPIDPGVLARLGEHYRPSVRNLRNLMQAEFPQQPLPAWLTRDA